MSASVVSAEEVEVVGTILEGAGLMPVVKSHQSVNLYRNRSQISGNMYIS